MIRHAIRTARDLLYPERCIGCGAFGSVACGACLAAMHAEDIRLRCKNCWAEWAGSENCPRCLAWDALDGALGAHALEGLARRMAHGLKYSYLESLAPMMGEDIAALLERHFANPVGPEAPKGSESAAMPLVFAVPIHKSRLKQRGFNQSELILDATGWTRATGTLVRVRKTESQVGKGARDRVRNVGGAFEYSGPPLTGLTVLLIDDVITTGATANECARVLKDHGARSVIAVAFARSSHDLNRVDSAIND